MSRNFKEIWNNRWFSYFRTFLIMLAIYIAAQKYQGRDAVRGQAPELTGSMITGEKVVFRELLKNGPVMVHFWGTWCPTCRTEIDNYNSVSESYQVITVATNSGSHQEINNFMKEHDLNFKVLNDYEGLNAVRWGVRAFPTTFVVDKRGEIHSVETGYTTRFGLKFRMWLASTF